MTDDELAELNYSQLEGLRRLLAAYPDMLPPNRICQRLQRYGNGDLGEWIEDPATLICWIRRRLGKDSVESVFSYRRNRRGRVVKDTFQGYRLSDSLAKALKERGI